MRVIIAAGGDRPSKRELLQYVKRYDQVVAADGACNWLYPYGVTPQVVVGDMDSIKPGILKAIEREGARLVRAPREKDDTDLMLAARYASEELKANEAVVFGGLGGRLDHTLGNLQVLAYLKNKGVDAFMVDESAIVQLMKGQGQIVADVGSTVSILPYQGNAVVTVTDGRLKYPLQALELRGDFPMGLSNVMETAKVSLKIEGAVLVIINRK